MDFSLSDDQRLIRDTVRQFMEAEVRPKIRQYDREEHFAETELRRLGELGCCGMLVPEEWGGAGLDTIAYVVMLEEVARVDAAIAVALSVTNSVAAFPSPSTARTRKSANISSSWRAAKSSARFV